MDVGILMVFSSYGWEDMPDGQVYDEEVRLARLAEDLGFDVLWPVEHHFFDYAFCPDNIQLLSYLAAATDRIDLGTAAVRRVREVPYRLTRETTGLSAVLSSLWRHRSLRWSNNLRLSRSDHWSSGAKRNSPDGRRG